MFKGGRIYFFIVSLFGQMVMAAPFCPPAPANCNLNSVYESLSDLKESRFMRALKSPDSVCKAALSGAPKTDQVLQEMMLDPRFSNYVNPQLLQCWKQNSSAVSKVEALGRYAYMQKRLDESAVPLVDYLSFADSVLGKQPLSKYANCKSAAPELAGMVQRCQEVKQQCKASDASFQLANTFLAVYHNQGIGEVEARAAKLDAQISFCLSEKLPDAVKNGANWLASVLASNSFNEKLKKADLACKELVKERGAVALKLQLFYGSFPWAQQKTFRKKAGANFSNDPRAVALALKAQVQENAEHVSNQLDEITSASRCLLRGDCKLSEVHKAIEQTNPLPDQYMFKKGQSKEQAKNRAAVSSFVSYNNCVDDMGQSQRKTSEVLWNASIGAVGAVATLGGSVAVTGLTYREYVIRGAAAVGSRMANMGKAGMFLGRTLDGLTSAQAIYEASQLCGQKLIGSAAKVTESAKSNACGLPSQGEMAFKAEHDACVQEMILGVAGAAAYGIGLKAQKAEKAQAAAAKAAAAKDVSTKAGTTLKAAEEAAPKLTADVASAEAKAVKLVDEKPNTGLKSGKELATSTKKKLNVNQESATSAIEMIRNNEGPEAIRKLVGKIDDRKDQGLARLRVATELLKRDLTPKEAYWILDAHKAAPIEEYGKIGRKAVREKILAGEGRPSSITKEQTRLLFEHGLLGAPTGKASRAAVISEAEDFVTLNLGKSRVAAKVLDVSEAGGVKLFKLQVKTATGLEERVLSAGQLATAEVKTGIPAVEAFMGEAAAKARRTIGKEDKFVNLSLNYKTVPAQIKSSFHVKDGERVYEVVHDTGDGLRSHFYSQYQIDIMNATKSERAEAILTKAISENVNRVSAKVAAVTPEMKAGFPKLDLKAKSPISLMSQGKRIAGEVKDVHTAANGEKVYEVLLRTGDGARVHFISETDLALREVKLSESSARMFHEARVKASRPEGKKLVEPATQVVKGEAELAAQARKLQLHEYLKRVQGKEVPSAKDIEMAMSLSAPERVVSAKRILGRSADLSPREQEALLTAHSLGDGLDNFTREEIMFMTSLLSKGGFSDKEVQILMRFGLVGKMP